MNKTSDKNESLHFDELTSEHQQRVLHIQKGLRLATVEETLAWIAGAAVEKAFKDYQPMESKKHE